MTSGTTGRRVNTRWRERFLAKLACGSDVASAAEEAEIEVETVYRALAHEPAFLRGWRAAIDAGYACVEMELLRRLRSGDLQSLDGSKYDVANAVRLLVAYRNSALGGSQSAGEVSPADVRAAIDRKVDEIRRRVAQQAARAPDAV